MNDRLAFYDYDTDMMSVCVVGHSSCQAFLWHGCRDEHGCQGASDDRAEQTQLLFLNGVPQRRKQLSSFLLF